jgi:hypothetical protein
MADFHRQVLLAVLLFSRLASAQWSAVVASNRPHSGHTATPLTSGQVLVIGSDGTAVVASANDEELYDPVSGTWTDTRYTNQVAFSGQTATLLRNGQVLVAGTATPVPAGWQKLYDLAEYFSPGRTFWDLAGGHSFKNRYLHTASLLPSDALLVVGGFCAPQVTYPNTFCENRYVSASVFTPDAGPLGTWTDVSGPSGFVYHSATVLASGDVLVVGGVPEISLVGPVSLNDAQLYVSSEGEWVDGGIPGLQQRRDGHTATLLPNGKVLISGGEYRFNVIPFISYLASVEEFDPSSISWSQRVPLLTPRAFHTATLLPSGKVLVTGGLTLKGSASKTEVASAELYDPDTGQWSSTAPMGTARAFHTATLLSSGKVLIVGGSNDGGTVLSSAELYFPLTITPWSTTVPPRSELSFAASGGAGAGYTWSLIQNGSAASLDSTGRYTAGAIGETTDVVQLKDSSLETVRARITVGPGVSISPGGGAVPPRGTLSLSASGGSGDGYVWSFAANRSNANLSNGSVYTAGPIGSVIDVVEVRDRLGNDARVEISVGPPVSISPSERTLPPRSTQSFSASGGSGTGYTWALVSNGSGGTVNASTGVYTAGPTGSTTDVVGVTDSLGNSAFATITVGGSGSGNGSSGGCGGSSVTAGPAIPWMSLVLILLFRRRR